MQPTLSLGEILKLAYTISATLEVKAKAIEKAMAVEVGKSKGQGKHKTT